MGGWASENADLWVCGRVCLLFYLLFFVFGSMFICTFVIFLFRERACLFVFFFLYFLYVFLFVSCLSPSVSPSIPSSFPSFLPHSHVSFSSHPSLKSSLFSISLFLFSHLPLFLPSLKHHSLEEDSLKKLSPP